jgi:rare lipoprotein A
MFAMYRLVIPLAVLLQACSVVSWDGDAQPVNNHQKSSRGNPTSYVVFGQRYYVMDSSYGYSERGVASWYGRKFHGKPTSSGEIYDMHEMTAAHKTLPLPTTVRVTNLKNGRSIIVKVNDRGPFVDNRIIDLSYVAARKLDMITNGTAFVEVEVEPLNMGTVMGPLMAGASPSEIKIQPDGQPVDLPDGSQLPSPIATAAAETTSGVDATQLYLQIGAFGEQLNAEQLRQQLEASDFSNVVVRYDDSGNSALYRVRLGPINDIDAYDALLAKIAALQIQETHLVTEYTNGQVEEISAVIARDPPEGKSNQALGKAL